MLQNNSPTSWDPQGSPKNSSFIILGDGEVFLLYRLAKFKIFAGQAGWQGGEKVEASV